MSKKLKEIEMAKARVAVERIEWFTVLTPKTGPVNVQRTLIDRVATIIGGDWLETASGIAESVGPHKKRLDKLDFGQSEGIFPPPIDMTWHYMRYKGQLYVADTEFYPYS